MLRSRVVEKCKCIGFEIDDKKNGKTIEEVVQEIGMEGARHRTLVCRTDEQVRSDYEGQEGLFRKLTSRHSSKWFVEQLQTRHFDHPDCSNTNSAERVDAQRIMKRFESRIHDNYVGET